MDYWLQKSSSKALLLEQIYEWGHARSRLLQSWPLQQAISTPHLLLSLWKSEKRTRCFWFNGAISAAIAELITPQRGGLISFLSPMSCPHPPPPCASSSMHLLLIKSWFDLIHSPGSKLLAFFFQLCHFIAILDIHHSWCKESGESIWSALGKERRMEKMVKVEWALLFWLWEDTRPAQL